MMDHLQMIAIVTHVADARTCILHPASHTHRQMTDEQLREAGIAPDLMRLSVGIESADDIIEDLRQGYRKYLMLGETNMKKFFLPHQNVYRLSRPEDWQTYAEPCQNGLTKILGRTGGDSKLQLYSGTLQKPVSVCNSFLYEYRSLCTEQVCRRPEV